MYIYYVLDRLRGPTSQSSMKTSPQLRRNMLSFVRGTALEHVSDTF